MGEQRDIPGDRQTESRELVAVAPRPLSGPTPRVRPARSPFLAQLARQYESREDATRRRLETRQQAQERYADRPPSAKSRHIVWA